MDDGMLSLGSWEDGSGSKVKPPFTAGRSGLLRGEEVLSRALMGTDGLMTRHVYSMLLTWHTSFAVLSPQVQKPEQQCTNAFYQCCAIWLSAC